MKKFANWGYQQRIAEYAEEIAKWDRANTHRKKEYVHFYRFHTDIYRNGTIDSFKQDSWLLYERHDENKSYLPPSFSVG